MSATPGSATPTSATPTSATHTQYAVFGYPVTHSLSPMIHTLFAEQTGEQITYDKIQVEGSFNAALQHFIEGGGKGANVTLPHKQDAFAMADELSPRARVAGAVNTLIITKDRVKGDNTDGIGLVSDLRSQMGTIADLRVLMIGAGGAARGVLGPLFEAGVKQIHLANRTPHKAEKLAATFTRYGTIVGGSLAEIPTHQSFDIVINSTSSSVTGQHPDMDPQAFAGAKLVYDMYYHKDDTAFMQFAKSYAPQVPVSDGLGMLVGQAAESFYLWRGVRPRIQPITARLVAQLG